MVMINTVQNNVHHINQQIHQFTTIRFNQEFNQMQNFSLAPGKDMVADIDVERLSIGS